MDRRSTRSVDDCRPADEASLPYHLIRAYGDAAVPYLTDALARSPAVWVRTHSARELALKGKREAFEFLLDAVTGNRMYRDELVVWLRDAFRLPPDYLDADIERFLRDRIANPQPPPMSESPIRAEVERLRSREASDRQAAARALLELAKHGPRAGLFDDVGVVLVEEVIRKPAQAHPDTWYDAAVILGRLRHSHARILTLYLERDGATGALIEVGDTAVPDLIDVLNVGGPVRRRLAAEVLGAIGSDRARSALSAALKTESDPAVRKAIDTALKNLGKRPPAAQIR